MSWKFPKYPVKNTQVIDLEDMNENFLESVEEIGGRLNEHNWKEGAIAATTSLEKDAAFAWHQDGAFVQRLVSWPQPVVAGAPKDQLIPARPTWTPVDDCSLTFTPPDCLLWIHGSVQLVQGASLNSSSGPPSNIGGFWNGNYFVYVQFAIQIDGYVIPETIIGGTEIDNDLNTGVRMPMMPLVTDIVFPITTGSHTIKLVVRTVGPSLDKAGTTQDTSPKGFYVSCREIMCLEMRR